jgi:glycosyltransferase involved in cell wall biosynthesis
MRLAYDLSILRHPPAGTARYAVELLRAMRAAQAEDEIVETAGWPRGARGGSVRRFVNLGSDLGWLTIGAATVAARHRPDAWFSPANILPLVLPRPKIVAILDANVMTAGTGYDRAYAMYATRMMRLSADRAAAILTLSNDARCRLIERLGIPGDRIFVAYPGIDHATSVTAAREPTVQPDATSPSGAPYALFVGQTEPHKNLERLVDAWAGDVPAGLDLIIAGPSGRAEAALAARIARSPVRSRIHRLGRVGEKQLAWLYENATCFVFPSLAEGFGMPPLEAMARSVPTAVADAGPLPEVTAGGAILFDPDRTEAIAAAVTRLVDDGPLRARLTAVGPEVAGRYTWTTSAATAWQVIRMSVAGG